MSQKKWQILGIKKLYLRYCQIMNLPIFPKLNNLACFTTQKNRSKERKVQRRQSQKNQVEERDGCRKYDWSKTVCYKKSGTLKGLKQNCSLTKVWWIQNFLSGYRSSRPEVFCEKGVLRNFAKFTGKYLCQSCFLNKVALLSLQLY